MRRNVYEAIGREPNGREFIRRRFDAVSIRQAWSKFALFMQDGRKSEARWWLSQVKGGEFFSVTKVEA